MSAPNEQPIDFSALPTLEPREGSYEEMLARRAARQKSAPGNALPFPAKVHRPVRPYWASAAAALLVVGIGLGSWFGLREQPASASIVATFSSSVAGSSASTAPAENNSNNTALAEAVEWYGELGGGSSSQPLVVADALFESF